MTKIILLNGPKYVGKTAIAEWVAERRDDVLVCPMMYQVKIQALMYYLNESVSEAEDSLHAIEDQCLKDCEYGDTGLTPRQMFTAQSEFNRRGGGTHAVSRLWKQYVSERCAVHRHKNKPIRFILVPDLRFDHEVQFIEEAYGYRSCHLVHVLRGGKDFFEDVGYYVDRRRAPLSSLTNEGTIEEAAKRLIKIMTGV